MIRPAESSDTDVIQAVYRSAFPKDEYEAVAKLAIDLLTLSQAHPDNPTPLSLVAEDGSQVAGHISFSPVFEKETDQVIGAILAPLAVHSDHQKRGIGSQLVEQGMTQMSLPENGVLLVYGDRQFYGRFGFREDVASHFRPPYPLQFPFGWQGRWQGSSEPPRRPVPVNCVTPLNDPGLW